MKEDDYADEERGCNSLIWQSSRSITLKVNGTHNMVFEIK